VNPDVKLTYDDYVHFPDDGLRHELIDGEHYVTPTPIRKHQAICANLVGMIWNYLREQPVGRVFTAPFDVILSNFDVVEPDSTRKRDATIKRRLYERSGVDEYWIIDPELDTIDVHRLTSGRYNRTAQLSFEAGDVLATPLLPGLTLPLSTIFED
jgi:Uma2 family endonuclease